MMPGACDWVGEFETTEFYSERSQHARKLYTCIACHGPIPVGALYERVFGLAEGEPFFYRYHFACLVLVKLNATELCGGYGWACETDLDDVMRSVVEWFPGEQDPKRKALMQLMMDQYDEVLRLYHGVSGREEREHAASQL